VSLRLIHTLQAFSNEIRVQHDWHYAVRHASEFVVLFPFEYSEQLRHRGKLQNTGSRFWKAYGLATIISGSTAFPSDTAYRQRFNCVTILRTMSVSTKLHSVSMVLFNCSNTTLMYTRSTVTAVTLPLTGIFQQIFTILLHFSDNMTERPRLGYKTLSQPNKHLSSTLI